MAAATLTGCPPRTLLQHTTPTHSRTIFNSSFFKRRPPLDPATADLLKKKPIPKSIPPPAQGDLAPSIFDDHSASPAPSSAQPSGPQRPAAPPPRSPASMAPALDPNPVAQRRWQRKMTIRAVRQRGRITRATQLARTEREHTARSHFFETSVKKLMPLARQIAGRGVDEALVQMRFSGKKAARDVRRFLEYARDRAAVAKGMGLGTGPVEVVDREEGSETVVREEPAVQYTDEKGRKKEVQPSKMYIEQAWVGRGPYVKSLETRARGRSNMIKAPFTSESALVGIA